MEGDWVCLHRKALNSQVFSDEWTWKLFCYCLMKANWTDGWFQGQKVCRGQFASSHGNMAEELEVSRHKVFRGLKKLQAMGVVESETVHSRFTLITVCKYRVYQDTKTEECTGGATAGAQVAGTIEQGKQEQQKKTPPNPPRGKRVVFDPLKTELPSNLDNPPFREAWASWCQHRQEIKKKLTPTAVKQQLKKLSQWGVAKSVAAIQESISQGWQGIFEPKATSEAAKALEKSENDKYRLRERQKRREREAPFEAAARQRRLGLNGDGPFKTP